MFAAIAIAASLACGVPAAQAEYETPEVQVYEKGARLVACHRATGRERVVGVRANDRMGTDESSYVNGVLGRRWVWTSTSSTFAESFDVQDDTLTDLRTGESVRAVLEDEDTEATAIALPGVLVVAGADGVTARFTDGRVERLSTVAAAAPAAFGARVYWREAGGPRTAVLTVPTADPPRRKPRARTIGRCTPRPNARLMLRSGRLIVTRAGGATWACRGTKQRRVYGDTGFTALGDRQVVFFDGVIDVATGARRVLPGMRVVSDGTSVIGAASWGLSLWPKTTLTTDAATEPAIGRDADGAYAYWLDGAGTTRVAPL